MFVGRCMVTLLLALMTSTVMTSASFGERVTYRKWESPEQRTVWPLVKALGEMAEEAADMFQEYVAEWQVDSGMEQLPSDYDGGAALEPEPELYAAGCVECRLVVDTIASAVRAGIPWEVCRNASIGICYALLANTSDWNEQIVCPGIIDAYGPHVYYIMSVTNDTAEEICQLWNMCPQPRDVIASSRRPDVPARPPSQAPRGGAMTSEERKKRRANAIKVLHMTDIHVDEKYLEGSETQCDLPLCCRDGQGTAGAWGDYQCNIPPRTVEQFMSFVAGFQPNFIIYTGDNPPHTVWEETQWGQLNVSRYVAEIIAQYMPGVPAYPAIGNHDTYPTNLYYIPRPEIQEFNQEYAKYWWPLARFGPEQLSTIGYNGYFDMIALPGLRVISYNSNYGHSDNFYNVLNIDAQDYADMQQFMEYAFDTARVNGEKVLLLSHHTTGGSGSHLFNTDFLQDILKRNGDLIVLWLLGHNHGDLYKMLTDLDTGEVFAVQVSPPSMTSYTDTNPSARLYYLDPVTFDVIDYEQYSMDLVTAMKNGVNPTIELVYTFTTEYNLTDATPASYKLLTDRFETDEELFYTYRYHSDTGVYVPGPCTDECLANSLCDLRTIAWDVREECGRRQQQ